MILLLHGNGWDEFLLLGGAILVAFLIVRVTSRDSADDPTDPPSATPMADHS